MVVWVRSVHNLFLPVSRNFDSGDVDCSSRLARFQEVATGSLNIREEHLSILEFAYPLLVCSLSGHLLVRTYFGYF